MKERMNKINVGDKIHCKNVRDLKHTAFQLSSEGYGVAVIGYADIEDHVLTITAGKEQHVTDK